MNDADLLSLDAAIFGVTEGQLIAWRTRCRPAHQAAAAAGRHDAECEHHRALRDVGTCPLCGIDCQDRPGNRDAEEWRTIAETLTEEVTRLQGEVDRLSALGGGMSAEEIGTPPFVLTPPSEEYRALYVRLGLGPGEIGPAWKEARMGRCPSCHGKLDGEGGEDNPWRLCAPCALEWAAEPDSFGVRET